MPSSGMYVNFFFVKEQEQMLIGDLLSAFSTFHPDNPQCSGSAAT
jgi:hypothetical protein